MDKAPKLGVKGRKLLAYLVNEIQRGRIKAHQPKTFISYGEALDNLAIPRKGRAEKQLQGEGLSELNEWTRANLEIPKIAGLIIDKKLLHPEAGFAKSHGHSESDWNIWWLEETARAVGYPYWERHLEGGVAKYGQASIPNEVLRETPERFDYRRIITLEPGKRGGRPCIRGMRITVGDVLGWLASGMSHREIISDFPELTESDIRACLAFAADEEKHAVSLPS